MMGNIQRDDYKLEIHGREVEIFNDPRHILEQYYQDFNKDEKNVHKIGN
jgi:hypothetical protein